MKQKLVESGAKISLFGSVFGAQRYRNDSDNFSLIFALDSTNFWVIFDSFAPFHIFISFPNFILFVFFVLLLIKL